MVRNNIFAFARDHQLQRTRVEPHVSFTFVTNIVYFNNGVLLGGDWSGDHFKMDWNIYSDARPGATQETMKLGTVDMDAWRKQTQDLHSVIADPLFVAVQKFDFTLQPNSPALAIGFRPIDLGQVGPRK
jgi:hypothetical protein